ncbi:MAG: hypothetical protein V7765_10790 [Oleispira sp.]
MRTFRQIIALTALFSVLSLTPRAYGDEFDPSWSLDFSVEPQESLLLPSSLTKLNAEISHITRLSCQQPILTAQQCQQIADLGGLLEILIDGNRDGSLERWSIGVARLKAGGYAKVLIIEDAISHSVIQTLVIESETPGFSALYVQQGTVMWGMCLSCDVLADIVWGDGGYKVDWLPNRDAELKNEVIVNNYAIEGL